MGRSPAMAYNFGPENSEPMSMRPNNPTQRYPQFGHLQWSPFWSACLVAWLLLLGLVPDPHPLGAPEWAVKGMQHLVGVSESTARATTSFALRAAGIGVLGVLLILALGRTPLRHAALIGMIGAPLLAISAKWVNFGFFPIAPQLRFIVAVAILSVLAGLALRRSRIALLALVLLSAGLFAWGTSTRIHNDLYDAASLTGQFVLEHADLVPQGNQGFAAVTQLAFSYAEKNSSGHDPVFANRAAILALGVILGEERIAKVARRAVEPGNKRKRSALRSRVKVHGRRDLSQHFWVSAALTALSDASRAQAVGITKELNDATPGGSGFSFVDMLANQAGIRLAVIATQDSDNARYIQFRLAEGVMWSDLFPAIDGLPEKLTREQFESEYGGVGGPRSRALTTEMERRIAALPLYQ